MIKTYLDWLNESRVPQSNSYQSLRNKKKEYSIHTDFNLETLISSKIIKDNLKTFNFLGFNKPADIIVSFDGNGDINIIKDKSLIQSTCDFFKCSNEQYNYMVLGKPNYYLLNDFYDNQEDLNATLDEIICNLNTIEFEKMLYKITPTNIVELVKKHNGGKVQKDTLTNIDHNIKIFGSVIIFPKNINVSEYEVNKYLKDHNLKYKHVLYYNDGLKYITNEPNTIEETIQKYENHFS